MTVQQILEVSTRGRSTTEITAEIAQIVRTAQVATGLANVFVLHTSCSVILTENADPTVRRDLETLAARWAPSVRDGFKKGNTHLALDDIRESIAELKHYGDCFIRK